MRLFLKYIVFIGCFGLASPVIAQSGTYHTIQDFESWTVAGLNYKPNQNLKLNLSQQLRLKDNTSTLEQYFTELTLRYKLPHRFKLGGGARYIHKNDDQGKNQGIRKYLRWNADLEYNHKINRFTWAYRLRYQSKDELEKTTDILQNTLRAKVGFAYNFKQWKLDPEFSSEIYHGLTDNEGLTDYALPWVRNPNSIKTAISVYLSEPKKNLPVGTQNEPIYWESNTTTP